MQVHLGSVSHVDVLVLEHSTKQFTFFAELSLLSETRVLKHFDYSCARSRIFSGVEGVNGVLVSSENDHFYCVHRDSYSWLLDVKLGFGDDERSPFKG